MDSYTISTYGRKPVFSSFLPGVAGERGIPLWFFYVNRGQAAAGFGIRDKNHSIMDFCPANAAYQRVQTHGFRTFIKADGRFCEPFRDGLGEMRIHENELSLSWHNVQEGWRTEVSYFVIPNLPMGMLARRMKLINLSSKPRKAEVLDGLAEIIPFGLSQHDLKMMGQTAKAWMMVENLEKALPYFRLRSSLSDTTSVLPVEDGSFGAAYAGGAFLKPIIDPAVIFDWDTSLSRPEGFCAQPLQTLLAVPQRQENELPCCFFAWKGELASGESIIIDSVFGLSHGAEAFHPFVEQLLFRNALTQKQEEARKLLSPYLRCIQTRTADPLFDQYCRQTFIDNFLRGGVPKIYRHGQASRLFYLFSRKHGDLERDYNHFVVTPEYASQGNGNYRDVLQNRRSDVRFCKEAGWEPLKPFLELIQPDGYNPLVIEPFSFLLPAGFCMPEELEGCKQVRSVLQEAFTPGALLMALENSGFSPEEQEMLVSEILCAAQPQTNASFGEGYWVDHWIYLLDMLESYLSVYPEKRDSLMNERCLRWYEPRAHVLPLHKRCVHAGNELRQHRALEMRQERAFGWFRDSFGSDVLSTPYEKLFMLCALKFASLDPSGEAISMEAGKPGWYDALNGLPGLFGSSVAESCELWRMLHFLLQCECSVLRLPESMARFAKKTGEIASVPDAVSRWREATSMLETYRADMLRNTEMVEIEKEEVFHILYSLEACVSNAVSKLIARCEGTIPTYFTNLPVRWTENETGIYPEAFEHRALPPFLEGAVHALRLPLSQQEKQSIITSVRRGPLFDKKLQMYKVSSDLSYETPELGRANAFTRGWLEHESIWLHMEYKYLLELLSNGFYDDFFRDFHNALIPFQPPERYGRSVLENSSFLASSANPDPGTHGRGFVARLSGATAEFLEMWQILFLGKQPFFCNNHTLVFSLAPTIPERLIPEDGCIEAMLLGQTRVIYHLPVKENITPASHTAASYRLMDASGTETLVSAAEITGDLAQAVRSGCFTSITAQIIRR